MPPGIRGSRRRADRAAIIYTLCRDGPVHNVNPQAWLPDVLARIEDTPHNRLTESLREISVDQVLTPKAA